MTARASLARVRPVLALSMLLGGIAASSGCGDDEPAQPESGAAGSGPVGAESAALFAAGAVSAAQSLVANACRGMRACRYAGQCTLDGEHCKATRAEDCKASLGCRDWGDCSVGEARCVPADDDDCRQAYTCRTKGRCSLDGGRCVVKSDSDCKRSEVCKYHRKCSERNGRCVKG